MRINLSQLICLILIHIFKLCLGSYSPDKLKKNNSMYSFGIKSRKEIPIAQRNLPGPGNYEIKSFLNQTHGTWSFGSDEKFKGYSDH